MAEGENINYDSDSDENYDPLYNDSYTTEEEMEEERGRVCLGVEHGNQQNAGAKTLAATGPGIWKVHPTQVLRPGVQFRGREKLTEPQRDNRRKGQQPQRYYQVTDSSSEDKEEQAPKKRPDKVKLVEVPQPLEWERPEQTTRMMARRTLSRISASPFTDEIYEAEPPKKFVTPRFTPYDGKTDLLAHYCHYMQAMTLWN